MKRILVDPEHDKQIIMDDGVNKNGRIRGNEYSFLFGVCYSQKLTSESEEKREGCLFIKIRNIVLCLCTTGIICSRLI